MKLWWIAPALAVCFSLVAWVGDRLVLQPHPRADLVEIRILRDGWPEAFISTLTSWATVRPGPEVWHLLPGAFEMSLQNVRLDYSKESYRVREWVYGLDGARFAAHGAKRGSDSTRLFGAFSTMESPVHRRENGGHVLHSDRAFEDALLFRDGELFLLGPLSAGETRVPLASLKKANYGADLYYAPSWLTEVLVCRNENGNSKLQKEANTRIKEAWGEDWVLLLRGGAKPLSSPGSSAVLEGKTVYWFIQLPAPQVEEKQ